MGQSQLITLFRYRVLPVPPAATANQAVLENPGENPDSAATITPAQRFANQLNELAAQGKAVQILQFEGFILVGEIAGAGVVEQAIIPGSVIGGADLKAPPTNKGNRGQ
jgi:hypothetical protein